MNIHEHQAKALLKTYGLPVAAGVAIFKPDEAEAAAKSLPGPLYVVKSQIHAGGRGKGKFKELRRRRQGRRAAGEVGGRSRRQRQGNAGPHAGHQADRRRPASRSTGSISKTAPISRASSTARCWSTARPARWRSWSRPKAAWTSRRWRTIRRSRSSPSTSTRRKGVTAGRRRQDRRGAEARRRGQGRRRDGVPGALQGVRRQGHEPARGQPADRHEGRPPAACSTPRSASTTTRCSAIRT